LPLLLELLGIVLLILSAVVLAGLLIPFDVAFEASKVGSSFTGGATVRWLGLTVWRSKPRKPKGVGTAESEEGRRRREFDVVRLLRILTLLRDSSSSLVTIAKAFRAAASVRRVSIDIDFGLGDPAETAVAIGYVWSVAWIINLAPRFSLAVRPDMERVRLDGSVAAQSRVRLLPLVVGFTRAYSHRSFRQLIREVRS
jgi:threonine/homoserine/homoserine lactone efflux protein